MSDLKKMTGLEALTTRHILTWFARQDEATQVQIMFRKHSEHQRLQHRFSKHSIPAVELAALVLASQYSGWADEQAYHSSKSVSEFAAKQMSTRRQARAGAYQSHREQVRSWLRKHWGKVMDMRRAGLSWRRVSVMIAEEHGICISHTTLHSYWRAWNERLSTTHAS